MDHKDLFSRNLVTVKTKEKHNVSSLRHGRNSHFLHGGELTEKIRNLSTEHFAMCGTVFFASNVVLPVLTGYLKLKTEPWSCESGTVH